MYYAVREALLEQRVAAVDRLDVFAAVEPDDVGEESICSGRKSRCARSICRKGGGRRGTAPCPRARSALGLVEEPERDGQRHGVEEVRTDRDHHVDGAGLDQLLADLPLGVPSVAGRVRHDEAGPAAVVQRRVELLDPQVVARCRPVACRTGSAGRRPACPCRPCHVERRVGHHEVELADGRGAGLRSSCWPGGCRRTGRAARGSSWRAGRCLPSAPAP